MTKCDRGNHSVWAQAFWPGESGRPFRLIGLIGPIGLRTSASSVEPRAQSSRRGGRPAQLFLRGHLAFVGLSQVRESAVFSGIPITEPLAEDQRTSSVCAVDLATGQVVALLQFETAVQEVFAVAVVPGKRYPELINDDKKLLENSFVVPDAALADVPASLRGPAEPTRGAAGSGGNGSVPRVAFVTA